MNLGFRRNGRQFFFCTACLKGRPQVLSRLVEGEKWPVLTPMGEGVKAALLAAHGWNAALTMSDFIVMPDHVHFLLIVDFDRDPGFDPSLEDSRAIAEGRLLLLSSFPPEIPVSPMSRANCEAMNGRILRLCGAAAEAICTSQTAGGPAAPRTPCNPAPGGSGGLAPKAAGGSGNLAPKAAGGSGEAPDRLVERQHRHAQEPRRQQNVFSLLHDRPDQGGEPLDALQVRHRRASRRSGVRCRRAKTTTGTKSWTRTPSLACWSSISDIFKAMDEIRVAMETFQKQVDLRAEA